MLAPKAVTDRLVRLPDVWKALAAVTVRRLLVAAAVVACMTL